jgi:hypothetical protein
MKQFIIIPSLLLLLVTGCKKKGCMESSGDTTQSVRTAAPFKEIDAYDNINIVLKQDTTEAITIEAGTNLQPYIKADIVNNILTFHNNSGCSWLRGPSETITAYVSVKSLSRINLYGSGNITGVNTITGANFVLDAYEAASSVKLDVQVDAAQYIIRDENADYTLSGNTGYATVYCGQKGTMDLRNLRIQNIDLDQRSVRDLYVWVTGTFAVKVQYKGNVYYKGTPQSFNYQHFNDGRLLPLQ